MEQSNLKVLFMNIFSALFIAGTASVHRLQLDLIEIETTLKNIGTSIPLVPEMLTLVLSSFVIAKFLFSYISLASHVIAFYPILNYDLSDLLIPTIFAQFLQNVLLNLAELAFGYFTCAYYLTTAAMACNLFYFRMVSKTILGIIILDLYWNYYNYLRYPIVKAIPTREFLKQLARHNSSESNYKRVYLFLSSERKTTSGSVC